MLLEDGPQSHILELSPLPHPLAQHPLWFEAILLECAATSQVSHHGTHGADGGQDPQTRISPRRRQLRSPQVVECRAFRETEPVHRAPNPIRPSPGSSCRRASCQCIRAATSNHPTVVRSLPRLSARTVDVPLAMPQPDRMAACLPITANYRTAPPPGSVEFCPVIVPTDLPRHGARRTTSPNQGRFRTEFSLTHGHPQPPPSSKRRGLSGVTCAGKNRAH